MIQRLSAGESEVIRRFRRYEVVEQFWLWAMSGWGTVHLLSLTALIITLIREIFVDPPDDPELERAEYRSRSWPTNRTDLNGVPW